jgi:hypothetical protein
MRLEREGIPCDVKAAEASDRPADQPRLVTVFVREIDAEQATTVMARAATGSATDDDEDDMPMPDSYYVKRWTCPRCHQKELEFLPLTRRIRRARLTWLALLVSPLLLWGIPWVVDAREALRTLSDYSTSIVIPWMVAIILGAAALPWPGHRCRSCAWRSDNPPAS